MGYTKAAVKGISWIAVLRASTRGMSFIKTLFLARILAPSQFGAYGVALLVLGFLEVMTETGVNVFLIQEKEIDKFINSAWLVSIIRGIIVAIVIILFTPFIAGFFNSPESVPLLYCISIVPFLRGFINPSIVKLQKQLLFNVEFKYKSIIFLIDTLISIVFTYITQNPLGIVIGLICGVIAEIIFSFIVVKPLPVFNFDRGYIGKIVHRGKWVTASGVFNYMFHNIDKIVVGRLLNTSSLGVYQMGYSISILPITEIADVFARVTFPVYAKIADDKKRLWKAFARTMLVISLLTIPFGLALIIFPEEIVLLILGDQWIAAAVFLPVLGIFSVIRCISGSISALFLAVNKQEYVTVVTFVSTLGIIIPIVPLVKEFGLVGAAYAALIGTLVAVPVFVYYTTRIFIHTDEKS